MPLILYVFVAEQIAEAILLFHKQKMPNKKNLVTNGRKLAARPS